MMKRVEAAQPEFRGYLLSYKLLSAASERRRCPGLRPGYLLTYLPDHLISRGRNRAGTLPARRVGKAIEHACSAHAQTPLSALTVPSVAFQVHGGGYEFQGLQGAHGAPSSPLPVVSREQGSPVRPCEELPQRCSVPGP